MRASCELCGVDHEKTVACSHTAIQQFKSARPRIVAPCPIKFDDVNFGVIPMVEASLPEAHKTEPKPIYDRSAAMKARHEARRKAK